MTKPCALDTWLMSCRAMGRTVEHRVMNHLAAAARDLGYERLLGEYLPTPKNVPVKSLLEDFGFKPAPAGPGGSHHVLRLREFPDMPTQVL